MKSLKQLLFNKSLQQAKGKVFQKLNQLSEALSCFDTAIDIDPNEPDCYLEKGNVYYELNNFTDAIKCYDNAIRIDPTNTRAYVDKISALSKVKKSD